MIHLRDINKTYQGAQPLHVLKGINLDIEKGEFVSIMGASGSGKSTLLNILGILDNYDSGEYLLKTARHREAYIKVNIYFAVLKTENAADAGEISEVFVRKIDSECFTEIFALRLTQKIKCIGIGCGNKTVLYEVIREEPYCVETVFGRGCVRRNALGGDTHRAAVPDCGDMLRCGNIGVGRKLNESITRHCIGNAAAVQPITLNLELTTELDGATVARKTYKYYVKEADYRGQQLIKA